METEGSATLKDVVWHLERSEYHLLRPVDDYQPPKKILQQISWRQIEEH